MTETSPLKDRTAIPTSSARNFDLAALTGIIAMSCVDVEVKHGDDVRWTHSRSGPTGHVVYYGAQASRLGIGRRCEMSRTRETG